MLLSLLIYEDIKVSFCWIAPIPTFTRCRHPPICTLCSNFLALLKVITMAGSHVNSYKLAHTLVKTAPPPPNILDRIHWCRSSLVVCFFSIHPAVESYVSPTAHGTNQASWPTISADEYNNLEWDHCVFSIFNTVHTLQLYSRSYGLHPINWNF